ncbi:MAG: hypothetical protein AB7S71_00195 [Dongiaceae bacterium]
MTEKKRFGVGMAEEKRPAESSPPPVAKDQAGRGAEVVRRLRGSGTVRMTTDEIMGLMRGE